MCVARSGSKLSHRRARLRGPPRHLTQRRYRAGALLTALQSVAGEPEATQTVELSHDDSLLAVSQRLVGPSMARLTDLLIPDGFRGHSGRMLGRSAAAALHVPSGNALPARALKRSFSCTAATVRAIALIAWSPRLRFRFGDVAQRQHDALLAADQPAPAWPALPGGARIAADGAASGRPPGLAQCAASADPDRHPIRQPSVVLESARQVAVIVGDARDDEPAVVAERAVGRNVELLDRRLHRAGQYEPAVELPPTQGRRYA